MRRETLERMDEAEIDEYAKVLGIELAPCETLAEKVNMIERRRERGAIVTVLGMDFDIPIKRVHDKRVADLLGDPKATDEDTYTAMALILGDAQMRRLVEACTDEDGTVDTHALGLAFVKVITSEQLKNF